MSDHKIRLDDVLRHLRNKNLAVFPARRGPMLGILDRLSAQVSAARNAWLARCGFHVVVSEQTVEIPLVLQHVRARDRRVLDFGGFESLLPLQLCALGHEVTVLDQRGYPLSHPGLTVWRADLFDDEMPGASRFDVVVSVSTIEHLGLGGYGDIVRDDGDREGVRSLWQLVEAGGRLIATVPAGRPAVQRGYRTYDADRLRATFPDASTVRWFRKPGRYGGWHETDAEAVRDLVYEAPSAIMPVEAVAFVVCDKPNGQRSGAASSSSSSS